MLAALLGFSALLVAMHVAAYPQLSPVDELQHIDYLDRASRGQIVRRGDLVGQYALREEACRGVEGAGLCLPSCDSDRFDPRAFQEGGFNTAEIHPPSYYLVTGLAARVVRPLLGGGGRGLMTAGRLVGALWLMAGTAVLWSLLGAFGVAWRRRVAPIALMVTAPAVLYSSSVVTNDATAVLAGAAVLLTAVKWQDRSLPGWVVVAVALAGVLFKLTNLIGVGVAVGYLLMQAVGASRAGGRKAGGRTARAHLLLGAAVVGGVAAGGLAWVVVHSALAEAGEFANPMSQRFRVDSLTLGHVLPAFGAGVVPLDTDHLLAPFFGGVVITNMMVATRWVLIGSSFGLAAIGERWSRAEAVAVSALVAATAGGPFFVLVNYLTLEVFVSIPSRYMLSAVPALAVTLALCLRKPWMNAVVVAMAAVSSVATVLALT